MLNFYTRTSLLSASPAHILRLGTRRGCRRMRHGGSAGSWTNFQRVDVTGVARMDARVDGHWFGPIHRGDASDARGRPTNR